MPYKNPRIVLVIKVKSTYWYNFRVHHTRKSRGSTSQCETKCQFWILQRVISYGKVKKLRIFCLRILSTVINGQEYTVFYSPLSIRVLTGEYLNLRCVLITPPAYVLHNWTVIHYGSRVIFVHTTYDKINDRVFQHFLDKNRLN